MRVGGRFQTVEPGLSWEHLHQLVAEVVHDPDGDAAGGGFGEGAAHVAVKGAPGFFVGLELEGGFEGLVEILLAEEVGLPARPGIARLRPCELRAFRFSSVWRFRRSGFAAGKFLRSTRASISMMP